MPKKTIQEVIEQLEIKVKDYQKFKIGKTGKTARDCFNTMYSEDYTFISELVYSDEPRSVDRYEKEIIKHFKGYPNNKNEKESGGAMSKSKKYIVYIVWS